MTSSIGTDIVGGTSIVVITRVGVGSIDTGSCSRITRVYSLSITSTDVSIVADNRSTCTHSVTADIIHSAGISIVTSVGIRSIDTCTSGRITSVHSQRSSSRTNISISTDYWATSTVSIATNIIARTQVAITTGIGVWSIDTESRSRIASIHSQSITGTDVAVATDNRVSGTYSIAADIASCAGIVVITVIGIGCIDTLTSDRVTSV
jgi:hypothetical protein